MKTLKINLDESIYDKFISFVKSFPEEKINIYEEIDDSHIEYMSDDEKKEVLEMLRDKEISELYFLFLNIVKLISALI